jgi:hypothetical protein
MIRARHRSYVLTHAAVIVIVGLAIPARETQVLLFVSPGNNLAPQQPYPEELAAGKVIPMQTSKAATARRVPLKLLDINLMV